MTKEELAALANGLVPYVRDCVAESFKVSPELAEQVASAIRLLNESPPITTPIQPIVQQSLSRIARIERDENGNLVPVYDEARS